MMNVEWLVLFFRYDIPVISLKIVRWYNSYQTGNVVGDPCSSWDGFNLFGCLENNLK